MAQNAAVTRQKSSSANNQNWRAGFGPDQVLQRIRPVEDKGYLPNPHRGTTTFQRFNGDPLYPGLSWNDREGPVEFKAFDGNLKNPRYPDTTLSYCRWLWSVLEPQQGKFRWDIIDGTLQAARVRGQTVQMRIQPFIGDDLPEWYWSAGGKVDKTFTKHRYPDENHPAYLKHFGNIIRAFGKRYDGHPDLESFDIAYAGACGETGGNSTPATGRKLTDIYLKSFKKTQLLSLLGTHGCTYAARHKDVGWRADCLGDMRTDGMGVVPRGGNWQHMYDCYPVEVQQCGVSETWKTSPVTLETCWTVGYWEKEGWDVEWIMDQALKYHASVFMPKSVFIPDKWRQTMDAYDRRLGYRFVLRQVNLPLEAKPGVQIPFYIWVENIGVAPLYRDYRLVFRFRQGKHSVLVPIKTDLRKWLPGDAVLIDKVTLPKSLQRGEVDVDIGIIDPNSKQAKVLFAIEPKLADRFHPLSKMDVL